MIVVLALGLALAIQAWVVKPYQIPTGSMEPTLDIGQRILVNRFTYHFNDPEVGDIVVFHPPAAVDEEPPNRCAVPMKKARPCPLSVGEPSDQSYVKRIVAGPGDTLSVRGGHPVVNGVAKTDEPYVSPCVRPQTGKIKVPKAIQWNQDLRRRFLETVIPQKEACDMTRPITIPPDHYFMMGDNRGASEDSRFWGPVPRDWIIGKAFGTYWPPNQVGGL